MQETPWDDLGDVFAPVETDPISEESEHGIDLQRLRFLSHHIDGSPLWVYAIYGRPDPCPKPVAGLVHIHGGSQSACIEHVRHFAARGYAIVSFDWSGPTKTRSEKRSTVFPDCVPEMTSKHGDPAYARVRHAVWAARRALTFLTQQPQVDAEHLGVFGISWGGLMTWLVNGTDDRVKAAIPIFGCGIAAPAANETEWMNRFQPARYAHTQHGDVLHLNGTNDFFGHWEVLDLFWDQLPDSIEKRLAYTPNEDHGLDANLKQTGRHWLDWKLQGTTSALPPTPQLTLEIDDGGLWCEVYAPEADQIRIFYAITSDGTRPGSFWYSGPWGKANSGFFSARWRLPIGSRRASVYAAASYPDGTSLSCLPQDLFEKVGTIALEAFDESIWYDPRMGKVPFYTRWDFRGTGLFPGAGTMHVRKSQSGGRLCLVQEYNDQRSRFAAILRRPACPVLGPGDGSILKIECFCPAGGTLTLTGSAASGHRSFDDSTLGHLPVSIEASPKWQKIGIQDSSWESFNFRQLRQLMLVLESSLGSAIEIGRISLD
jgi:dienelactone hydrolase